MMDSILMRLLRRFFQVRDAYSKCIATFPSPYPSPSGRGDGFVATSFFQTQSSCGRRTDFDSAAECSLSPRERAGVRGNGAHKFYETVLNYLRILVVLLSCFALNA